LDEHRPTDRSVGVPPPNAVAARAFVRLNTGRLDGGDLRQGALVAFTFVARDSFRQAFVRANDRSGRDTATVSSSGRRSLMRTLDRAVRGEFPTP